MTVGASGTTISAWLNYLRGTTATGLAGLFVKLHTADPGAAGATAPSAVTTRNTLTLNASAAGSPCTLASLAAYSMTATETISHVSVWDNVSAGTFICSGALSVAKAVNNGDTLTFTTFTASITPIAA